MIPTNSPTHEAISRRAREIWIIRGNPTGLDTAIWHEAEQQLTDASSELPGLFAQYLDTVKNGAAPGDTLPTAHPLSEAAAVTPDPIEIDAKAAAQKKSAKAPRLPTHQNAPKPAPTESGKPLWNQPHSS